MIVIKNKELSKVFAKTIPHILPSMWGSKPPRTSVYICHALVFANAETNTIYCAYTKIVDIALSIINDRLDGHTMASWLIAQGIPDDDLITERVQAHRVAWLKLLVEEFDKPEIIMVKNL